MPSSQIERKLAAILFMDIAGYTEHMSKDKSVDHKSPNPNEQAYGRISKTLLKIVRALKFTTNREITLKSFRNS